MWQTSLNTLHENARGSKVIGHLAAGCFSVISNISSQTIRVHWECTLTHITINHRMSLKFDLQPRSWLRGAQHTQHHLCGHCTFVIHHWTSVSSNQPKSTVASLKPTATGFSSKHKKWGCSRSRSLLQFSCVAHAPLVWSVLTSQCCSLMTDAGHPNPLPCSLFCCPAFGLNLFFC